VSVIISIIRAVLLPVLAVAILVVYGHVIGFVGDAFPRPDSRFYIYLALFAEGFVAACAVALIFVYPLVFIYRHNAGFAALFVTLPVLYFRLPEVLDASRSPISRFVSGWQIGAFCLLLVLGTAVTYRNILRSNPAFDPDAPMPTRAGQRER
jgi:hypothetical protein